MLDSLCQHRDGAPEFACPSIELLGLVHLIPARAWQAQQSIRLLLKRITVSTSFQALLLVLEGLTLFAAPAVQSLA